MPLPHDLVCAGVILGEVDDQRIEQNQRRLPEQRARCTDTGFRPMRTASAGSHFADGGRGDFAGEVHRPVPTDQKSAVRTKAADRGARAPDVHLAKDIAGHPRSTMRQTTRENSISICPLPARRYWWRWWPGPGSNRRPSAFRSRILDTPRWLPIVLCHNVVGNFILPVGSRRFSARRGYKRRISVNSWRWPGAGPRSGSRGSGLAALARERSPREGTL